MALPDLFNPSAWGMTQTAYDAWWTGHLSSTLSGFIPRFIASVSLGLVVLTSFTRRLEKHTIIMLYILTLVVTYYGTFLDFVRLFR